MNMSIKVKNPKMLINQRNTDKEELFKLFV